MRQSPRRPLILKRRKLPFQQSDQPPATTDESGEPKRKEYKPPASQSFPDGTRIVDHPTLPGTQVVVIPRNSDLKKIIGVLSAKGKECGPHGPNKFILLSGNGNLEKGTIRQPNFEEGDHSGRNGREQSDNKADLHHSLDIKTLSGIKLLNKDLDCSPLDDSLTNIQWLGKMSTDGIEPDDTKRVANKENHSASPQTIPVAHSPDVDTAVAVLRAPMSERPPYSYMAMIQFAINSKRNRRMMLKDIYTWIEDHFPFFRDVAKPGWKNSIRHNLSLHDMFIREATPDGKISYWTIRPEANRCLTLDQVYKPGLDPTSTPTPVPVLVFPNHQQKRMVNDGKKTTFGTERKMKPLLPRTDSYLVPIQLPVSSSLYLSSSSASTQLASSASQQKQKCSRGGSKKVRIAPKVTHSDASTSTLYPPLKVEIKEEPVCVPLTAETPPPPPPPPPPAPPVGGRKSSGSRRKQSLVLPPQEEPLLLFPDSSFFDSGLASDASAFQDTTHDTKLEPRHEQDTTHDTKLEPRHEQDLSCRDYTFKTPIKGGGGSHLASSTPSKPLTTATAPPEPWKVTPLGKGGHGSHGVLDFSPIRTPGGPAVTPQRPDYATFSFSSTPFKELALFSSPRELLTPTEPLTATGNPLANRSFAEGLVLDTMNDSLSKILVDISFSGLEDEELGMGNISWSEFLPQLK